MRKKRRQRMRVPLLTKFKFKLGIYLVAIVVLKFVLAEATEGDGLGQFGTEECHCTDIAPPGGSCRDQAKWGKCEVDWMLHKFKDRPNGYCQTTCGRCGCPGAPVFITARPEVEIMKGEACACTDIRPPRSRFSCEVEVRFFQRNQNIKDAT
ncbi:hypothetical protein BSKO_12224 [Bryopsis sp. KO-2023]|nr:hypothetical protein BSKO_12224 [Bryopsis sp. KO-2023]